jgi:hypothetical protein
MSDFAVGRVGENDTVNLLSRSPEAWEQDDSYLGCIEALAERQTCDEDRPFRKKRCCLVERFLMYETSPLWP